MGAAPRGLLSGDSISQHPAGAPRPLLPPSNPSGSWGRTLMPPAESPRARPGWETVSLRSRVRVSVSARGSEPFMAGEDTASECRAASGPWAQGGHWQGAGSRWEPHRTPSQRGWWPDQHGVAQEGRAQPVLGFWLHGGAGSLQSRRPSEVTGSPSVPRRWPEPRVQEDPDVRPQEAGPRRPG